MNWIARSFVACVCVLFAAGCGNEGAPTAPSTGAIATRVSISGPTQVAPGDRPTYTATAEYSDGSSLDVTAMLATAWGPPAGLLRPPIYFTGPGVAFAAERGETDIRVSYGNKGGVLHVLVIEPGTFKLGGVVSDASGGSLSGTDGVTIEVLSGTGSGLTTAIDWKGQYLIYGVAGPVQLRASAPGFTNQVRDVVVTGNDRTESFALKPAELPVDVSGVWTMTLTLAPGCRGLPDIMQERAYQLQLIQQGPTLSGTIRSATLKVHNPNEAFGKGTVRGSRVRIDFLADEDWGQWTSSTLWDHLSPTEVLQFSGVAEGAVTGNEIRATMDGDLVYSNTADRAFRYCRTKDHSVTLRR